LASEDVGLADPEAATGVAGCWDLCERVGMPEGRFHLSQAALYLATCPKSNSTLAFFDALSTVEGEQESDVPTHLRDGNRDSEGFGHGKGYLYPHAYRDHWVSQQYLPDSLQGKAFYEPGDQGYEKQIALRVARQREAQLAAMVERETPFPETFTTGIQDRARDAWLQRAISDSGRQLGAIRDRLFESAKVQRHHLVLDLNAGSGLLTWEAVRQAPEGGVWALAQDQKTGEGLRQMALRLPEIERPVILIGKLAELDKMFHLRGEDEIQFDRILGRNGFTKSNNRGLLMEQIVAKLQPDGKLCLAQVIPSLGQRLYQLFDWTEQDQALCQDVQRAEEDIYEDPDDPLVNWNIESFEKDLVDAGFLEVEIVMDAQIERRTITNSHLDRWFGPQNEKPNRAQAATVTEASAENSGQDAGTGTYRHKLANAGMDTEVIEQVSRIYRSQLKNQSVSWNISRAYITARR
jgi:putative ATPase